MHVWIIRVDESAKWRQQCMDVLKEPQRQRANFLAFEQDKNAYVVSQGGLALLLSAYLKIPPSEIKIGREPKGKPFSLDNTDLHFNLSNSGNICAFAFCLNYQVGMDVEKVRHLPDLETLLNTNFTAREIEDIKKSDDEGERFFRYWTMKESYLKAIGEGMRLTPDNLEFSSDRNGVRLLSVNGVSDGNPWNFQEFLPSPGYVGTLTHSDEIQKCAWYVIE